MLAHLKSKRREETSNTSPMLQDSGVSVEEQGHPNSCMSGQSLPNCPANPRSLQQFTTVPPRIDECPTTRLTCDALCSLSNSVSQLMQHGIPNDCDSSEEKRCTKKISMGCPKQEHQLPMFLSKTYHMIDRCDPSIATWSPSGDSFVVKSVERFATSVLPMYFKHSNFSSFARQLNFYGFRKLKAEPILTADFDACTACYVRFYHDKFQRDRPELLVQIKRATKSDQQSKDDVEDLKAEISRMKDCINAMASDYERRFSEMSYEYNRRITALSAEYDELAALMHKVLEAQPSTTPLSQISSAGPPASTSKGVPDLMQSLSQAAVMSLNNSFRPPCLNAMATGSVKSDEDYTSQAKRSAGSEENGPAISRQRFI